ncbi:MAG: BamA/TamA family outer membrane protein [Bacteroidota bacterium]
MSGASLRIVVVLMAMVWCQSSSNAFSQSRVSLFDTSGAALSLGFKPGRIQTDSAGVAILLNKLRAHLLDEGFLASRILKHIVQDDRVDIYVVAGEKYVWDNVRVPDELKDLPANLGLGQLSKEKRVVRISDTKALNKRILEYFENNGYPFASVRYGDVQFDGPRVSATIIVDKGDLISIDSFTVVGDCKLSVRYLTNYLSLAAGDVYDERLIRRIQDRINELPMVTEVRPFAVAFSENKCRILLFLKDKKASQADGVIGVQPPSANSGEGSKTRVTADLRIRLLSSFGRGELFDFNWKQPSPLTQDLKTRVAYPFLFDTPFGLDAGLAIYKKDTTYVDVDWDLGVQFLLEGGDYFRAFIKDKRSSLVSTDKFANATTLPPFADIRKTLYGGSFKKNKLDYRLNPRKGYALEVSASAGNRTVDKNPKLPEALYDSLKLRTLQFTAEWNSGLFIPAASRLVFFLGIRSGLLGSTQLFENELYRLGGISTIRGFDEESIKASTYVIGKFELRYLLDRNSNMYLFFDQAWYERKSESGFLKDTPFGFGAGISFDSKLGIFSINYALGSERGNPILFKSAKLHFGVVNYF